MSHLAASISILMTVLTVSRADAGSFKGCTVTDLRNSQILAEVKVDLNDDQAHGIFQEGSLLYNAQVTKDGVAAIVIMDKNAPGWGILAQAVASGGDTVTVMDFHIMRQFGCRW